MNESPNNPPPMPSTYIQTSSLAILSLVTGIASWFILPVVGAVIAVITGYMAKNEIRSSNGQLTGDGLATTGIVLGFLHFAIILAICCIVVALLALGLSIPIFNQVRYY